jgi:SEC-C motif-containing protein
MSCLCGSSQVYEECCGPIIDGERLAPTAETLMRARYSAYAGEETEFLLTSLHPDRREEHDADAVRDWAEQSDWLGLEILDTAGGGEDDDTGRVEFVCLYEYGGKEKRHHEKALFEKVEGQWYFVSGEPVAAVPFVREEPKVGRNDPCSCGSGKKYKKCCGKA